MVVFYGKQSMNFKTLFKTTKRTDVEKFNPRGNFPEQNGIDFMYALHLQNKLQLIPNLSF